MLDAASITIYYSQSGILNNGENMTNKIAGVADIGVAIRKKRKEDGLTLADAAALCGVGYRFLSDLENGKETVQLGKALKVLTALGLDVYIETRKWPNEQQ